MGQNDAAAELRAAFAKRLGHLPSIVPLDATIEERVEAVDHVRDTVSIASSPGVRFRALVLIPRVQTMDPGPRAPGILAIHQHNGEYQLGKSEPAGLAGSPEMAYGLELCRGGNVIIVPDLEGFEERQAPPGIALRGGDYERFIATRYVAQGSSLQARYVWDLARAVDYLVSRPEVDPSRIGAIGHSLGGQEVCWALLFDRRIRAGVSSCGIGTLGSFFVSGINHNQAAYVPGMLEVGDIDQLAASLAPTPLMMTAGTTDPIFPIDGVRSIARAASAAYERAGCPDAFRFVEFEGGHGFAERLRREAYAWLERWLRGREPAPIRA
jgi:dienelactone hydrolase